MAVRVKIDSIATDINLIVNEMLSPEAQSVAVANYARDEIQRTDDTNKRILGRAPVKTVTVDGRAGAPLESVRPVGGSIIAEWDLFADVLTWIAQTLKERSPRVSGDYIKGHALFADGIQVDPLGSLPQAEIFTFINLVPYARKLEVGKTESGRDFLIQVPNRIYERTYQDAKARFGNQAKITFGYETQTGAYRLKSDQRSRHFKGGRAIYSARQRADRVAGSAVSVPAIRVSFRDI